MSRHQRGQSLHELQRRHHDMRGAVARGGLEFEHHLPGGLDLYPAPDVGTPELKGFNVTSSIGLFAPAATPAPILARLNRELNEVLAMPDVRKTFQDQAASVGKGSSAEFADFLRKELVRKAVAVKAANTKAE